MWHISTLDPERLLPSDYMDLSGHFNRTPLRKTELSYSGSPIPFPPNTRGFFYYHRDPALPPIAGQLRFRLTPKRDPASFAEGTDLLRTDFRPWGRSLLIMAAQRGYALILARLLEDGLIDSELLGKCETLLTDAQWKNSLRWTK